MKYIYARVSTKNQSTKNQLNLLKEKYPDAVVISDEGVSGTSSKKAILKAIHSFNKGDELIVWKLDRLSRDQVELLAIMAGLQKRGVNLISYSEPIPDNAAGVLLRGVLAAAAESERLTISERTKLGLKRAISEGKNVGGKRDGAGRPRVNVTETEVEFVKRLRAKGTTWNTIRLLLNDKFETRNWATDTVRLRFKKYL